MLRMTAIRATGVPGETRQARARAMADLEKLRLRPVRPVEISS